MLSRKSRGFLEQISVVILCVSLLYQVPTGARCGAPSPAKETQLFSGTLVPFFFGGCPTENGLPAKGFPFFQGH